jgi:hypothetical protein
MKSMKLRATVAVALMALFAPLSAFAVDQYATLISAVDFTSVTTDVIAVAALVVAVLVALRAVRFIFSIVRR